MEESPIQEQEDALLVSPTGGGDPFHKKAYFLKPIVPISSIDHEPPFKLPQCPFRFDPKQWPLEVEFHGWRQGQEDWNSWVDRLAPIHQSTWKRAGIYDAIFNSKYQIRRKTDLVFGFAEKWCSETNTFIFPWGEATITLEDVMVLGGFSVSGDSIFSPLESIELKEVEERLIKARKEVKRAKASKWLQKFVNSESELEHEAFLAFWLSREREPRVELCKFEELLSFVDVPLLRRQPESLASSLKAKQCSMLQNMHKQSGNCMLDGITKLLLNTTLPTNNLKLQSPTFILLHQQRTESKNIPINQRAAIRRWFNRRTPAASIKNLILILFSVARASCILPVILHNKQEQIS